MISKREFRHVMTETGLGSKVGRYIEQIWKYLGNAISIDLHCFSYDEPCPFIMM